MSRQIDRQLTSSVTDQEVVHPLARLKLRRQPAGLLPTTRPSLGVIFRVPVFGKDLRVRTASVVRGDSAAGRLNLAQPFFKSSFLFRYLAGQYRSYLLVQTPQLLRGHGLEDIAFHVESPAATH